MEKPSHCVRPEDEARPISQEESRPALLPDAQHGIPAALPQSTTTHETHRHAEDPQS